VWHARCSKASLESIVRSPLPKGRAVSDQVLSDATFTAVINAPIEQVDIASWLFNLSDAEFQRCCPPDHIAVGFTTTDDGRPMSINVERIGDGLVVQHYIGEITEKHHCRMVSRSDVYGRNGRTKIRVIWEQRVKPIDDRRCEYSSRVVAFTTSEYMTSLEKHGITLEEATAARQAAASSHQQRETPLFARSLERRALTTRARSEQRRSREEASM
jgi:hypothetical protein